jgi:hypothetical protein
MRSHQYNQVVEAARQLDRPGLQQSFTMSPHQEYSSLYGFRSDVHDFYLLGMRTGDTRLCSMPDERILLWEGFFPRDRIHDVAIDKLGTLAHVASLLKMVEKYGLHGDCTVLHASPSTARRAHLNAMGLGISEQLEPYLAKSIAYANRCGFSFENPLER